MTLRWIKVYPALLRAYWARALEYRGQIIIWILSSVLPLVMLLVWLTIAEEQGGTVSGYDQNDFISYFLAIVFMRRMVGVWIIWDLDASIRKGELSPQLLRPIDPVHHLFARVLAIRPLNILLMGPPFLAASWAFSAQYDLSFTSLFFVVAAILGATLAEFFAQMIIGAMSFWITQSLSVAEAWFFIRMMFSGYVVPLDMFPTAVTNTLFYLPFRYMLSFPTEIFLGRLETAEIGQGFAVQLAWVITFYLTYSFLWQRGLKQYSAVGA